MLTLMSSTINLNNTPLKLKIIIYSLLLLFFTFSFFAWCNIPPDLFTPSISLSKLQISSQNALIRLNGIHLNYFSNCNKSKLPNPNKLTGFLQFYANNKEALYMSGVSAICADNIEEGINYIKESARKKFLMALLTMAIYYRSDKTFKRFLISQNETNRNLALNYLERGIYLIKTDIRYPTGINWNYESSNQVSVQIFTLSLNLYHFQYIGFSLKVIKNLKANNSDEGLQILKKIQKLSYDCLKRPPLLAWGYNQNDLYNYQQTLCHIYSNMAQDLIILEEKRIRIADICSANSSSVCLKYRIENKNSIIKKSNDYTVQINKLHR